MGTRVGLGFHGGHAGALVPLFVFLVGVAWLGLSGAPGEQGLWPILLAALAVGLVLARDRHAYAEAMIEGMSQPIVMVMVMAWLLAGVFGELMKATGLISALVWSAQALGVSGVAWVLAAFVISCLVSTSTGTSLGTLILATPLLYPAGGPLGADPALLIGAILGGATFGDNISPVSDTTIASTVTQGARIGEVVKSRLRFALPAAALAMLATLSLSALLPAPDVAQPTAEAAAEAAEEATMGAVEAARAAESSALEDGLEAPSPAGLPMLLVPVLVVVLLFRHVHLLEGLLAGIAAAAVFGFALGRLTPGDLLRVDGDAFTAQGLLVDGMQRGVGVSIFTLLLMGLVAGIEQSGLIERVLSAAERRIDSPRAAETWSFLTVSVATLLTTHSVVALLAVGRFARLSGERHGLSPTRRANILDTTVCTYPFLLPYCIPTILAASLTKESQGHGMPQLDALTVGLHNLHSWALLAVIIFIIWTGWGRTAPAPSPAAQTSPAPSSGAVDFLEPTEKVDDWRPEDSDD